MSDDHHESHRRMSPAHPTRYGPEDSAMQRARRRAWSRARSWAVPGIQRPVDSEMHRAYRISGDRRDSVPANTVDAVGER